MGSFRILRLSWMWYLGCGMTILPFKKVVFCQGTMEVVESGFLENIFGISFSTVYLSCKFISIILVYYVYTYTSCLNKSKKLRERLKYYFFSYYILKCSF